MSDPELESLLFQKNTEDKIAAYLKEKHTQCFILKKENKRETLEQIVEKYEKIAHQLINKPSDFDDIEWDKRRNLYFIFFYHLLLVQDAPASRTFPTYDVKYPPLMNLNYKIKSLKNTNSLLDDDVFTIMFQSSLEEISSRKYSPNFNEKTQLSFCKLDLNHAKHHKISEMLREVLSKSNCFKVVTHNETLILVDYFMGVPNLNRSIKFPTHESFLKLFLMHNISIAARNSAIADLIDRTKSHNLLFKMFGKNYLKFRDADIINNGLFILKVLSKDQILNRDIPTYSHLLYLSLLTDSKVLMDFRRKNSIYFSNILFNISDNIKNICRKIFNIRLPVPKSSKNIHHRFNLQFCVQSGSKNDLNMHTRYFFELYDDNRVEIVYKAFESKYNNYLRILSRFMSFFGLSELVNSVNDRETIQSNIIEALVDTIVSYHYITTLVSYYNSSIRFSKCYHSPNIAIKYFPIKENLIAVFAERLWKHIKLFHLTSKFCKEFFDSLEKEVDKSNKEVFWKEVHGILVRNSSKMSPDSDCLVALEYLGYIYFMKQTFQLNQVRSLKEIIRSYAHHSRKSIYQKTSLNVFGEIIRVYESSHISADQMVESLVSLLNEIRQTNESFFNVLIDILSSKEAKEQTVNNVLRYIKKNPNLLTLKNESIYLLDKPYSNLEDVPQLLPELFEQFHYIDDIHKKEIILNQVLKHHDSFSLPSHIFKYGDILTRNHDIRVSVNLLCRHIYSSTKGTDEQAYHMFFFASMMCDTLIRVFPEKFPDFYQCFELVINILYSLTVYHFLRSRLISLFQKMNDFFREYFLSEVSFIYQAALIVCYIRSCHTSFVETYVLEHCFKGIYLSESYFLEFYNFILHNLRGTEGRNLLVVDTLSKFLTRNFNIEILLHFLAANFHEYALSKNLIKKILRRYESCLSVIISKFFELKECSHLYEIVTAFKALKVFLPVQGKNIVDQIRKDELSIIKFSVLLICQTGNHDIDSEFREFIRDKYFGSNFSAEFVKTKAIDYSFIYISICKYKYQIAADFHMEDLARFLPSVCNSAYHVNNKIKKYIMEHFCLKSKGKTDLGKKYSDQRGVFLTKKYIQFKRNVDNDVSSFMEELKQLFSSDEFQPNQYIIYFLKITRKLSCGDKFFEMILSCVCLNMKIGNFLVALLERSYNSPKHANLVDSFLETIRRVDRLNQTLLHVMGKLIKIVKPKNTDAREKLFALIKYSFEKYALSVNKENPSSLDIEMFQVASKVYLKAIKQRNRIYDDLIGFYSVINANSSFIMNIDNKIAEKFFRYDVRAIKFYYECIKESMLRFFDLGNSFLRVVMIRPIKNVQMDMELYNNLYKFCIKNMENDKKASIVFDILRIMIRKGYDIEPRLQEGLLYKLFESVRTLKSVSSNIYLLKLLTEIRVVYSKNPSFDKVFTKIICSFFENENFFRNQYIHYTLKLMDKCKDLLKSDEVKNSVRTFFSNQDFAMSAWCFKQSYVTLFTRYPFLIEYLSVNITAFFLSMYQSIKGSSRIPFFLSFQDLSQSTSSFCFDIFEKLNNIDDNNIGIILKSFIKHKPGQVDQRSITDYLDSSRPFNAIAIIIYLTHKSIEYIKAYKDAIFDFFIKNPRYSSHFSKALTRTGEHFNLFASRICDKQLDESVFIHFVRNIEEIADEGGIKQTLSGSINAFLQALNNRLENTRRYKSEIFRTMLRIFPYVSVDNLDQNLNSYIQLYATSEDFLIQIYTIIKNDVLSSKIKKCLLESISMFASKGFYSVIPESIFYSKYGPILLQIFEIYQEKSNVNVNIQVFGVLINMIYYCPEFSKIYYGEKLQAMLGNTPQERLENIVQYHSDQIFDIHMISIISILRDFSIMWPYLLAFPYKDKNICIDICIELLFPICSDDIKILLHELLNKLILHERQNTGIKRRSAFIETISYVLVSEKFSINHSLLQKAERFANISSIVSGCITPNTNIEKFLKPHSVNFDLYAMMVSQFKEEYHPKSALLTYFLCDYSQSLNHFNEVMLSDIESFEIARKFAARFTSHSSIIESFGRKSRSIENPSSFDSITNVDHSVNDFRKTIQYTQNLLLKYCQLTPYPSDHQRQKIFSLGVMHNLNFVERDMLSRKSVISYHSLDRVPPSIIELRHFLYGTSSDLVWKKKFNEASFAIPVPKICSVIFNEFTGIQSDGKILVEPKKFKKESNYIYEERIALNELKFSLFLKFGTDDFFEMSAKSVIQMLESSKHPSSHHLYLTSMIIFLIKCYKLFNITESLVFNVIGSFLMKGSSSNYFKQWLYEIAHLQRYHCQIFSDKYKTDFESSTIKSFSMFSRLFKCELSVYCDYWNTLNFLREVSIIRRDIVHTIDVRQLKLIQSPTSLGRAICRAPSNIIEKITDFRSFFDKVVENAKEKRLPPLAKMLLNEEYIDNTIESVEYILSSFLSNKRLRTYEISNYYNDIEYIDPDNYTIAISDHFQDSSKRLLVSKKDVNLSGLYTLTYLMQNLCFAGKQSKTHTFYRTEAIIVPQPRWTDENIFVTALPSPPEYLSRIFNECTFYNCLKFSNDKYEMLPQNAIRNRLAQRFNIKDFINIRSNILLATSASLVIRTILHSRYPHLNEISYLFSIGAQHLSPFDSGWEESNCHYRLSPNIVDFFGKNAKGLITITAVGYASNINDNFHLIRPLLLGYVFDTQQMLNKLNQIDIDNAYENACKRLYCFALPCSLSKISKNEQYLDEEWLKHLDIIIETAMNPNDKPLAAIPWF